MQGQASPRTHDISPEPVAHLSQHRLVPMLLSHAASNAVGSAVRFDHTVTGVTQTCHTVTVATRTSQVCSLEATPRLFQQQSALCHTNACLAVHPGACSSSYQGWISQPVTMLLK